MPLINLIFSIIKKELVHLKCPHCNTLLLVHKNHQIIKCVECDWNLAIAVENPNQERLKKILAENKLKRSSTDHIEELDLSNTSKLDIHTKD